MQSVSLTDGAIDIVGALDLDQTATGVIPRRLPAWTRPQIPDLFMDVVVQLPSGVRLRCATDSTSLELDVLLTNICRPPLELKPAMFDLVVDGEIVDRAGSTEGNLITLSATDPSDVRFDNGEPTTIAFHDLPDRMKVVELWLPVASIVELRALRVGAGSVLEPAPAHGRLRWIHYGSSISHCIEASSPTSTWPAVAARAADVDLLSLGLAGQCMLDQFVARTIRDQPADLISLKVGINVINGDSMRERTFGAALHGFLDTVREGHPETPILLVSPIICPTAEEHPGPTVPGPDGRYVTVRGLEAIRQTCLTLTRIRTTIASIVDVRRNLGDTQLTYLDGLQLFGADDVGDLPDGLHPNAAGYVRIGERFAQLALAKGGPLVRGS